MRPKEEKKLRLGKVTIQDLNCALDRTDQKMVKGGTADSEKGTTQVPVFCKPTTVESDGTW